MVGAGGVVVGSAVTTAVRAALGGRQVRRRAALREAATLRQQVSETVANLHTIQGRLDDLIDRINSEERNRP